jgi:hypothetical protein
LRTGRACRLHPDLLKRNSIIVRGSKTLFAQRGHGHGGNLGSDLLGKEDAMLNDLGEGSDPSVATSMFLNNVVLFLPPVLPPWKPAADGASATGYPLRGEG